MVVAAALTEAGRRRATAVDEPDYVRGFDLVVNPSRQRSRIVLVADIAGAFGAGLIGYAINIYTGETLKLPGHIAMGAGVALTVMGFFLKHVLSTE